ncbi:hypothetical protein EV356DRAFT_530987 [Viridothelium virens]|uniref:Uncharacterized protein n=1 Tax=Viridothelium virens TaxID=1048519 RepID=A0A6A6HE46_VIRVR|nr:hypothetical protein EV356DRAFT_530987 [Viridothelium virens]
MGVDTTKPPLPAPTDESGLSSTEKSGFVPDDLATDVSRMTDKTSFSIPEDGSPITISTKKIANDNLSLKKGRHQSQTSLLIEYFEGGKESDKLKTRPSVRVKVTPSSARKASSGSDHIQITETGKNRKPSYTRRISLGGKNEKLQLGVPEGTEVSYSDESNVSGRPPVEVEVLHNNGSELSASNVARGSHGVLAASDISSMPPDSMLEGGAQPAGVQRRRSRSVERTVEQSDDGTLKAPARRRSRSLSRERIKKRVMQELAERPKESSRHKHRSDRTSSKDYSRHRSSRHSREDDPISGAESSHLSASNVSGSAVSGSAVSGSQQSFRSGTSGSSITNPKLLHTVEDAIRRLILPELNALKEERKTDHSQRRSDREHRDSYASANRDSYASASTGVSRDDPQRRLSKSSSAPNVIKKPKVVLNRDEDDSGVTLAHGDSVKSRKVRRSSRESTSERSLNSRDTQDTVIRDEKVHRKKSKDSHRVRDAAAAGLAGGILTAAALRHHDSRTSMDSSGKKKKRRSKSSTRSHSHSVAESLEASPRKDRVPPMPMRSEMEDSELTRDSILSAETQRPDSMDSIGIEPPIREVSRGSIQEAVSPTSRTPTRTPNTLQQNLGTQHSNASREEIATRETVPSRSISGKAKAAGLAAAGLGGTLATKHVYDQFSGEPEPISAHDYASQHSERAVSPVQSEVSYDKGGTERLDLRDSGSAAHRSVSNLSLHSAASSPSTKQARSRKRPRGINLETGSEVLGNGSGEMDAGVQTPGQENYDDWYERQHEENERIRRSLDSPSQRDSSVVDYKHLSTYTDESLDAPDADKVTAEQDVREIGANPDYVRTPLAVESAVASLHEPSSISVRSSQSGPLLKRDGHSNQELARQQQERDFVDDQATPTGEDRYSPSKDRWAALRDHARTISGKSTDSGEWRQPSTESQRIRMSATGIPDANDPMPEIGHGIEDGSEINTNPSIIQGPIGGTPRARDTWGYDDSHSPAQNSTPVGHHDAQQISMQRGKASLLPAAAAAVAGAGVGAALVDHQMSKGNYEQDQRRSEQQPFVEDDQSEEMHENMGEDPYVTQDYISPSPEQNRDEGYISARSPRAYTPEPYHKGSKLLDDDGFRSLDDGMGMEDPFTAPRHVRHLSGNSHGMASPLYDAATGKGMDSIKSKDVVALMDHLTVRDAQRNARDTEILVTLVRSAAEMRNSFEEMKKFIAEQDRMIMANTDKDADITVQKVLGGPRPQPEGSPRIIRRATDDSEDVQAKRKNIFRRALKGLGSKSSNDISRMEGMLTQLLTEVEELKANPNTVAQPSARDPSLNSYENLRAAPDPGYEPEGQAGTGSTATNSGYLSNNPSRERTMHSGYDGRRGSEHRISTVMEGDEDLDEQDDTMLDDGYINTERLLTPTQEARPSNNLAYDSPTRQIPQFQGAQSNENTPRTERKSSKHQSNTSSLIGIPRISRWSKTTASSAPDNYRRDSRDKERPESEASRSGSQVDVLGPYDDEYDVHPDDRLRSQNSLNDPAAEEHYQQEYQRTQSPLVPGEDPIPEDELYVDDPKYQAHRNSLNLQHPQPRPGPTSRHKTNLESQAFAFGNPRSPDADLLGSNPSLSLARNRLSGGMGNMSPVQSDGGSSNGSYNAPVRTSRTRDEGPLVPQQSPHQTQTSYTASQRPPKISVQDNSGYNNKPYNNYSSPLGSGTLLEPIEEVRYSLESEGGGLRGGGGYDPLTSSANRYPMVEIGVDTPDLHRQLSPDPSASPGLGARGLQAAQPGQRKITGPRPMGSRSPGSRAIASGQGQAIGRKPVHKSQESFGAASGESETF